MLLIFTGSGDASSGERSSRILAPLLRWLFPGLSPDLLDLLVTLIRKCAHLTEFAILALLFWHALRRPGRGEFRPWAWSEARRALLLTCLYAASDELHQLFVPNRQAAVTDVLIDTTGAALGLLALWLWYRWRASAARPRPVQ